MSDRRKCPSIVGRRCVRAERSGARTRGGERGGASATSGSTNPGGMESEGGGKPTQREASVFCVER